MDRLYEAIGGLPALEVAVNRFCERVRSDMEVAEFFVWRSASAEIPSARLQILGGPTRHSRATIRRRHAILPIRQRQVEVVLDHLVAALHGLGIGDALVAAVMERIWSLAMQIVNTGSARAAAA